MPTSDAQEGHARRAREPGQFQHVISTTTRLLLYYLIAEEDFCVNKTLESRPSGKTDQETLASVVHSPWFIIWSHPSIESFAVGQVFHSGILQYISVNKALAFYSGQVQQRFSDNSADYSQLQVENSIISVNRIAAASKLDCDKRSIPATSGLY